MKTFTLCLAARAKGATSEPAFDAAEIRTTTELIVWIISTLVL